MATDWHEYCNFLLKLDDVGGLLMGISNTAPDHKPVDLTELVGTQLFRQVSMAQVAALLRYCPTLTLANGDRLVVPGQTVDQIYLLLQGTLQVFDGEPAGQPVGQILQGECVGLSSFVDRQPCHVSIVSNGICRLLVLDEARLMALTNTPTAVSRNLLFMLMTYLRKKAARPAGPAAPPVAAPEPHNHIDTVTGLHNRRWLEETLDRLILRAATDRAPLSLLAVELNDLPGLTGQHGEETLGLALREIARNLGNTVRPTDLTACHATGRFVILLPGTDLEHAETAATRVRDAVNNMEIVIPGACVLPPMSVSTGCVQMKAFVSGRKLVDDAFATLAVTRGSILAARRKAEAEAAAAAEIAALAAVQAKAEAEAAAAAAAAQAAAVAEAARKAAEAEAARLAEQAAMDEQARTEAVTANVAEMSMGAPDDSIVFSPQPSMDSSGSKLSETNLNAMTPMDPESAAPALTSIATFQPDTPEVEELSAEESAALLAQFATPEDNQPDADSGSGELAGNVARTDASPPAA
jgi:diguanylate cyclase (GGDEF)-like protein